MDEIVPESPESPTSESGNKAEEHVESVQTPETQEATNEASESPPIDDVKVDESVPAEEHVKHSTDLLQPDNAEQDKTFPEEPQEEEPSELQKESDSVQMPEVSDEAHGAAEKGIFLL